MTLCTINKASGNSTIVFTSVPHIEYIRILILSSYNNSTVIQIAHHGQICLGELRQLFSSPPKQSFIHSTMDGAVMALARRNDTEISFDNNTIFATSRNKKRKVQLSEQLTYIVDSHEKRCAMSKQLFDDSDFDKHFGKLAKLRKIKIIGIGIIPIENEMFNSIKKLNKLRHISIRNELFSSEKFVAMTKPPNFSLLR